MLYPIVLHVSAYHNHHGAHLLQKFKTRKFFCKYRYAFETLVIKVSDDGSEECITLLCNINCCVWRYMLLVFHMQQTQLDDFYCCTVRYGIYILFTYQQMHFLLNLEKYKLI